MLGLVAAGTLGYLPVNLRDSALALDGVCSVSLLCALTVSVFWHCSLLDGVPVTIRASLSQRVVSYTETARACRQVSGLVATPAQWTPCSRQNGAGASSAKRAPSSPTKQLGDHSWLINSLGDVSAARAAPNDGADAAAATDGSLCVVFQLLLTADPDRCVLRLICEAEFVGPRWAASAEERLVHHLFGARPGRRPPLPAPMERAARRGRQARLRAAPSARCHLLQPALPRQPAGGRAARHRRQVL
ncbi:hypothetical protein FJT64_018747 [Amphibalanus amphitrite]|uniref:Uncharacterized protein n=1 Tax=Amphibalanus amphitrite TaxID=1232801 RepID=A0A6A4WTR7_AMPAM|nr:hypothetical protein FJT64_018747 [Amphibalanus amphitrite]